MFVLAFDRDWTVDVNGHPTREAVPLDWVRYWAHDTDHEVWAIGNQDLVEEADIPGTIDAIRRRDGDLSALGEQDDMGRYEWWPEREERLQILASLFPEADRHIVVDDLDLRHVEGWDHYHAWDFMQALRDGDIALNTPHSDSLWTDGGFQSEESVRNVLETGELFEVTYREEGSQQKLIGTYREPERPSAKPLHGPPVFHFTPLSEDKTLRIRLPQLIDVTPVSFDSLLPEITDHTVSVLVQMARNEGECVPLCDVTDVLEAARDTESLREDALRLALVILRERDEALEEFGEELFAVLQEADLALGQGVLTHIIVEAQELPASVAPYVSELAALATDSAYEEFAVRCLVALAEENPIHSLDAVPALATAAQTGDADTREWAIYGLSLIAAEHPEEVYPTVSTLIEAIQDGDETVRTNALTALGRITGAYPDAAAPVTSDLVELLNDDHPKVRNNAVGLLGDIAQQYPAVVIEYADAIAGLLEDPNSQARINASLALLAAGEADPNAVLAQHEQLEAALEDSEPAVRANACTLVANAKAPVPVEKLRTLRETDPDETVRERAAESITRLRKYHDDDQ